MPIKVNVKLVDKGIDFKEFSMKPYDCINDIKRKVENIMDERQNPIEEWGADIEIIIRGPLAIKPKEEEKSEWDIEAGMNVDEVLGKSIKVDNLMATREKF